MTLYNHPPYFKSLEINRCELSPLPTLSLYKLKIRHPTYMRTWQVLLHKMNGLKHYAYVSELIDPGGTIVIVRGIPSNQQTLPGKIDYKLSHNLFLSNFNNVAKLRRHYNTIVCLKCIMDL